MNLSYRLSNSSITIKITIYRHQARHLIRRLNRARVYSRLGAPASF